MSVVIAERVARGAALLDEREPGWWANRRPRQGRISLEDLDLGSPCRCVLGQLHPRSKEPFMRGLLVLRLSRRYSDQTDMECGFNAPSGLSAADEDRYYALLTAEWKRLITGRRRVAPGSAA